MKHHKIHSAQQKLHSTEVTRSYLRRIVLNKMHLFVIFFTVSLQKIGDFILFEQQIYNHNIACPLLIQKPSVN